MIGIFVVLIILCGSIYTKAKHQAETCENRKIAKERNDLVYFDAYNNTYRLTENAKRVRRVDIGDEEYAVSLFGGTQICLGLNRNGRVRQMYRARMEPELKRQAENKQNAIKRGDVVYQGVHFFFDINDPNIGFCSYAHTTYDRYFNIYDDAPVKQNYCCYPSNIQCYEDGKIGFLMHLGMRMYLEKPELIHTMLQWNQERYNDPEFYANTGYTKEEVDAYINRLHIPLTRQDVDEFIAEHKESYEQYLEEQKHPKKDSRRYTEWNTKAYNGDL